MKILIEMHIVNYFPTTGGQTSMFINFTSMFLLLKFKLPFNYNIKKSFAAPINFLKTYCEICKHFIEYQKDFIPHSNLFQVSSHKSIINKDIRC